jgi:hypothetical protein
MKCRVYTMPAFLRPENPAFGLLGNTEPARVYVIKGRKS